MKVPLLRLSYFVWLLAPLGFYAFVNIEGLPHVRYEYEWANQGQGYDPFAHRYYTMCRFIGPYGVFTLYPADGHCAWIRFESEDTLRRVR